MTPWGNPVVAPPIASASLFPAARRHSTCRMVATPGAAAFASSFESALPFAIPEDDLDAALTAATSDAEIDAAVKKALADGARPGCPVIEAAETLKKDMAEAAADGKPAPKFKPKKPPVGGAIPGFMPQGEGRVLGKTHDNSV